MTRLTKDLVEDGFFFSPAKALLKAMETEDVASTGHGTVPVLEVDGMTASLSHLKGVEIQVR